MSLLDSEGRPADHRITLRQIGQGVLMNLGARDYVHDDPNGMVMFMIGRAGGTHYHARKAIIKLNDGDLYDVEIGRMHRKSFEWVSECVETNIFFDQLGETLIRMHAKVTRG